MVVQHIPAGLYEAVKGAAQVLALALELSLEQQTVQQVAVAWKVAECKEELLRLAKVKPAALVMPQLLHLQSMVTPL